MYALNPYFAFMPLHDGFGNGKAKTEASGSASCRICAVESFEQGYSGHLM